MPGFLTWPLHIRHSDTGWEEIFTFQQQPALLKVSVQPSFDLIRSKWPPHCVQPTFILLNCYICKKDVVRLCTVLLLLIGSSVNVGQLDPEDMWCTQNMWTTGGSNLKNHSHDSLFNLKCSCKRLNRRRPNNKCPLENIFIFSWRLACVVEKNVK